MDLGVVISFTPQLSIPLTPAALPSLPHPPLSLHARTPPLTGSYPAVSTLSTQHTSPGWPSSGSPGRPQAAPVECWGVTCMTT